jgi:predicted nucleic acid-binding protein
LVLVDASIWIEFFADKPSREVAWLDSKLSSEEIGLTDLTLCEVLQGIRGDASFRRVRDRLMLMPILSTGGIEMAILSAWNFRVLRAKGITVRKTIDCLIATFCIERGHALLHRDRDFDPFETHLGLRVIHP